MESVKRGNMLNKGKWKNVVSLKIDIKISGVKYFLDTLFHFLIPENIH